MICGCGRAFECNFSTCAIKGNIESCLCPECAKKYAESKGIEMSDPRVQKMVKHCFGGTSSEDEFKP